MNAYYRVQPSWGYTIELRQDDEIITVYTAGNSPRDSQVYNSQYPLDHNTLSRYARQTAREMLVDAGYPKGKIIYDKTL